LPATSRERVCEESGAQPHRARLRLPPVYLYTSAAELEQARAALERSLQIAPEHDTAAAAFA